MGKFISRLAVPLIAAAVLPLTAFGRYYPKVTPRTPYAAPYEVLTNVNLAAQTITIQTENAPSHSAKSYRLNEFTKIQVNGVKGTIKDLVVGMQVTIGLGMDADVADTVVATPAPVPPKKPRTH